jgi:hypothetical protein
MQDHTLSSHFETLFRPHKLTLAAHSTTYQYRLNLRRFDEYLERPATIADLQDSARQSSIPDHKTLQQRESLY